jgi:hypothetical protein
MRHLELLDLHKAKKFHFDFKRVSSVHFQIFRISVPRFIWVAPFLEHSTLVIRMYILKIIMMVLSERHRFVFITPASCSARLRFKSLLEARLS